MTMYLKLWKLDEVRIGNSLRQCSIAGIANPSLTACKIEPWFSE